MGCLVLAREVGETIRINDDIVITFIRGRGGSRSVVAIEAPSHVRILRGELYDALEHARSAEENKDADAKDASTAKDGVLSPPGEVDLPNARPVVSGPGGVVPND